MFKCRITANGAGVKMDTNETTTANTDMQEVRSLHTLASTDPNFTGDTKTADALQGYLQT